MLEAVDPYWNPREHGWSVGWQRMFAKLHACVDGGTDWQHVLPGVTVGGEDVGRWLRRQREVWALLADGQRQRLTALGVTPALVEPARPASSPKPGGARAAAWERGLRAARQYRRREGTLDGVSRGHVETVVDDDGQEHAVRLGVWLSNQRSRRSSLTAERAELLNGLGLRWV